MFATNHMEFALLDKSSREFARKVLKFDDNTLDPYDFSNLHQIALEKAFSAGYLHTMLPEELGGIGRAVTPLCTILYNVCREDASFGCILYTHSVAQELILLSEQQEFFGNRFANADHPLDFIIAYPIYYNCEEANIRLNARQKNGGFLLSGQVENVALAGIANACLLPAWDHEKKGVSFFFVDLDEEGVLKSSPVLTLGLHGCPSMDLDLTDVPGQLVGEAGKGSCYFAKMLEKMMLPAASMAAGIMKHSFDEAVDYARKRVQGGTEIINWSEVQMILANMAYQLKISEMTIDQACQHADANSKKWEAEVHATAVYTLNLACDLTSDGIQIFGGYGYTQDCSQERYFRDAKQLQTILGLAPVRKLNYLRKYVRT